MPSKSGAGKAAIPEGPILDRSSARVVRGDLGILFALWVLGHDVVEERYDRLRAGMLWGVFDDALPGRK